MVTRHGKALAEIKPRRTFKDRASSMASIEGSGEALISPATPEEGRFFTMETAARHAYLVLVGV
jgi:hypothetical protein